MNKEQLQYLESVGITGPLIAKVEAVYQFYSKFIGTQIDDIFVSEYLNKDGSRVFENLWFFNDHYCYEAKQFMSTDDYDADLIRKSIAWYSVKKTDFDIVADSYNDNSRMILTFGFAVTARTGEMKASRVNCKKLAYILKKYILANQIS